MSISLLREDKLWGLIACHHYPGPHAPPYATRAAAEFLGSTLSLRLVDRAEDEEHHRALQVRSTMAWLTAATLDEDRPLAETLLGPPGLLDVVPADGVVVTCRAAGGGRGGAARGRGDRIAGGRRPRGRDVVATDALRWTAPHWGCRSRSACGVLACPCPRASS